ncbi:MAG: hypothetical protein FWD28_02050 [Treponema sp.]|nr:hypothetical protein [Treponema sp.]
MKPDAIFYFSRMPEHRTRYKQIRHKGIIIPGFPSVYKSGKKKVKNILPLGKRSIITALALNAFHMRLN